MKILSIQNANPSFNGAITVRNSKTNLIRYHYSNLCDDKRAGKAISKYVDSEIPVKEKAKGLIEYLEVMFGASKDEAIGNALADLKAGKIDSVNAICNESARELFSKVELGDTVIMHSADIRFANI